jgi:hypothetical protein
VALLVDGMVAPVVHDGEEDADVMQKRSANSNTWSASPISSCDEVEVRLVRLLTAVSFGRRGRA